MQFCPILEQISWQCSHPCHDLCPCFVNPQLNVACVRARRALTLIDRTKDLHLSVKNNSSNRLANAVRKFLYITRFCQSENRAVACKLRADCPSITQASTTKRVQWLNMYSKFTSVIELLQNLQETLVRKERGTRRKHNAG